MVSRRVQQTEGYRIREDDTLKEAKEMNAFAEIREIQAGILRKKIDALHTYSQMGLFVTEEQAKALKLKKTPVEIDGKLFVYKDEFRRMLKAWDKRETFERYPELCQWLNFQGKNKEGGKELLASIDSATHYMLLGLGGEDGRKIAMLVRAAAGLFKILEKAVGGVNRAGSKKMETVSMVQRIIEENTVKIAAAAELERELKRHAQAIKFRIFEKHPSVESSLISKKNHELINYLIEFIGKDENYKYLSKENCERIKRLIESSDVRLEVLKSWKQGFEDIQRYGDMNRDTVNGDNQKSGVNDILTTIQAKIDETQAQSSKAYGFEAVNRAEPPIDMYPPDDYEPPPYLAHGF